MLSAKCSSDGSRLAVLSSKLFHNGGRLGGETWFLTNGFAAIFFEDKAPRSKNQDPNKSENPN